MLELFLIRIQRIALNTWMKRRFANCVQEASRLRLLQLADDPRRGDLATNSAVRLKLPNVIYLLTEQIFQNYLALHCPVSKKTGFCGGGSPFDCAAPALNGAGRS